MRRDEVKPPKKNVKGRKVVRGKARKEKWKSKLNSESVIFLNVLLFMFEIVGFPRRDKVKPLEKTESENKKLKVKTKKWKCNIFECPPLHIFGFPRRDKVEPQLAPVWFSDWHHLHRPHHHHRHRLCHHLHHPHHSIITKFIIDIRITLSSSSPGKSKESFVRMIGWRRNDLLPPILQIGTTKSTKKRNQNEELLLMGFRCFRCFTPNICVGCCNSRHNKTDQAQ